MIDRLLSSPWAVVVILAAAVVVLWIIDYLDRHA